MYLRLARRRGLTVIGWRLWAEDRYPGHETKARLLSVVKTQSFFYLDDRSVANLPFDKLVSLDHKLVSVVILDMH